MFDTTFATIMLKIPTDDEPLPLSCMTDAPICATQNGQRGA